MNSSSNLRGRVHRLLNPEDRGDRLSHAVNLSIIFLILLNVLSASLETVPSLYEFHGPAFRTIELLSVGIFSIEYLLRFWSAPDDGRYKSRLDYFLSFNSVIDLLAITPFYLGLFFHFDLRALIALRLLRLLKLVRYFQPLAVLGAVMRAEFRGFITAMFVLVILVFIAATGIYYFERDAQPEVFGSIPESMWWAIVTLTTLGYGDVIPVTAPGRVFAALITVFSVVTVALPTGMLASRFSEELKKRKEQMDAHLAVMAASGKHPDDEALESLRNELCISEDDLERLLARQLDQSGLCPVCGRGGEQQ